MNSPLQLAITPRIGALSAAPGAEVELVRCPPVSHPRSLGAPPLLSSSMKTDLRHPASDWFETFRFPEPDPRALIPALAARGEQLYQAAYGWQDIQVPPFCPKTEEGRPALTPFEDEVIDRLYVLNAERATEEARLGLGKRKPKAAAAKNAKQKQKPTTHEGLGFERRKLPSHSNGVILIDTGVLLSNAT